MKKKLVKFLAMGLALTMGLAACGNNGGNADGSNSGSNGGSSSGSNGGAVRPQTTAPWQVLMTLPSGCPSHRESQT